MMRSARKIIPFFLPFVIAAAVFAILDIRTTQAVTIQGSITQTDDSVAQTGFNFTGSTFSSAVISGTGASASVQLPRRFGTGASGALDLGTIAGASFNLTTADGPDAGTTADGIATALSAQANSGQPTVNISSTTGFSAGDEVLLIQMYHHVSSGSSRAGIYELGTISSVGAGTLTFTNELTASYCAGTSGTGDCSATATYAANAQAVRVPQYTSVTVPSGETLTASIWDGAAGGIIVFRATGTVTVGGTIQGSALGFAGGQSQTANFLGGYSGASFANTSSVATAANSGGGGGGKDSDDVAAWGRGGSGGSYGTSGIGGITASNPGGWSYCNPNPSAAGTTYGTADLTNLFLGSGGGSGGRQDDGVGSGTGGKGGGIVAVFANSLIVSGTITTNGASGAAAPAAAAGAGGGGSGGSILLNGNSVSLGANLVTAAGGSPGANTISLTCNAGGGGSGRIAVLYNSLTGTTDPSAYTTVTAGFSPGTYTSGVLDSGQASDFTTIGWNATTPASTSVTMEMRTGANPAVDGTWMAWTALTNGADTGATFDGKRYAQYRATLTTSDAAVTPSVNDITINYQVSANYNFSLSSSAPNDIIAGATTAKVSTVTATVQNPQDASITDAVNFSATVSPSGPVISFSPPSCLPGSGTCTVDLYASSASVGNYTIDVRGNNTSATYPNGITKNTAVSLTVSTPMAYTSILSAYQGEVIKESATAAYPTPTVGTVLTVTRSGGADEGIASITSNVPAGVTMNASPPNSAPFGTAFVSTITFFAASTVASGDYAFNITITPAISGAGNAQIVPFTLKVRAPLTYSLSASPASGGVFQGNSVASTIIGTYGGYPAGTESVTISNFSSATNPGAFSSVPAVGTIFVSFSGAACTLGPSQASCAKTMTISNSSNTTVGNYTITISGASSLAGTAPAPAATYTLTVSGPFDFTMAMGAPIAPCTSSTACTTEQGTNINVAVDISSISPVGENVSIEVNGLPANTTYSVAYAPNPCVPSFGVSCVATISIAPSLNAPIGMSALSIVGKSSKQMHALSYALTITQGFTFDIALSASSGVVTRGGATAASIVANITVNSGTGKPVALSITPFGGVDIQYPNGQSCTPNCSRQIIFTAPPTATWCGPNGICTYNINITGTYGTQTVQKPYTLTVVDPFDFSLALSSAQGSILQGTAIQTVAALGWVKGGSGIEAVSLSASVVPSPTPLPADLTIDFNPPSIIGLGSSSTPLYSTVTLTASGNLTSDSYTVIIIATSGTVVKTKTYALTVGTTLDFSLSLLPDNERVMQGASSAPVVITALNNLDQPASSDISFTIGDTSKYKLPKDVTVAPDPVASCALGAPLGATCSSTITFSVGPTAVDGTYLIPILGASGPVKRIVYYTLKIGPLNLKVFSSPNFMTDAHQRPQVSFTWSPPAVFAGDTVQFDASPSTVYVAEPNLSASTPASGANATFSWTIPGMLAPPAISNPSTLFTNSGLFDVSLVVADKTVGQCYNSISSATEACACAVSASEFIATGGGMTVSKARPSFREITPQ